ncbi:HK97 gp10 family phage protein [Salinibacter grassmerensis]|uniref:HK97 gp10 family phage protein n=1 Tax=Salinibacter grassmerensis TaxID=3040353 RepID=UPI0021E77F0E|nr:HK97 gp10 family phage protein [Salinibacter grassmerensis]
MLDVEFDGFEEVEEQIEEYTEKAVEETKEEVDKTTKSVQNKAKDNAPEETGTLVRGYQHELSADGFSGVVFNPVEYAKRIEFGFVGTDELGRTYTQKGQFPLSRAFREETKDFGKRLKERIEDIETT